MVASATFCKRIFIIFNSTGAFIKKKKNCFSGSIEHQIGNLLILHLPKTKQ
jgi:hypothetical protein